MIRWVRAHPYTTATPFAMAAVTVLYHVLTPAPWWKSALFTLAVSAVACFNAWLRRVG